MSDTPRTESAFAIANLHENKRMKPIYDEMCQLEREHAKARRQLYMMAVALREIMEDYVCGGCIANTTMEKAEQALAAVKGGSHE